MTKNKNIQIGPTLFDCVYSEVDEISIEDLEAASNKFDDIVKEAKDKFPITLKKLNDKLPDNSKIIDKLRKSAQSLINQSEKINTDISGNWTRRRQSFADNAMHKKDNLIKYATILNRLADLWENNECPEILKGIRSASDFDTYYPRDLKEDDKGCWFEEEQPKLLKKAIRIGLKSQADNQPFKDAIKQLSEIVLSPEEIKKRELDKKLVALRSSNIPGFFPTPDNVIDIMIEHAKLDNNMSVLEPSAGIGSICDRLRNNGHIGIINACEIVPSLYDILRLKGYVCSNEDILSVEKLDGSPWDRIIMNPPFEKKQDIIHVLHCYNTFLKYGGILVSVMSSGVMNNTDNKSENFREFVDANGYFVELGQQFNNSNAFRNTGVSTVLCVLRK